MRQQWIPFGLETFEHFYEDVLFLTKADVALVGQVRPGSTNPFLDGESGYTIEDITHWAPLPSGVEGQEPNDRLQREVTFLRELVSFPQGPFENAHAALSSCAALLVRLADAHEGL